MTSALAEIESLCDEMRRSAAQGDWEAVETALTVRDGRIREVLAAPNARDHAPALRRALERDREIVTLARKARDEVAAELRQLDNGRKAIQAYGGQGQQNRQSRRTLAGTLISDEPTSGVIDPAEA